MLFYIGKRTNPQLQRPYYKAYGKLSIKDAKAREKCAYGSMSLTPYKTEQEYNKALAQLTQSGYKIVP